eukprot:TRINITY_DN1058_c0_g1_i2.p1 TRINITY_DN1058_c0_g1~~TRINITY_DN1058_c0_g1_i2.p1  ORF type:complete len:622 (-),score=89.93 TRINITY_DN1058_c0_g1_i2:133-1977(-)
MNTILYAVLSLSLSAFSIINAYAFGGPNFYASLFKSNLNILILANSAFVLMFLFCKLIIQVFFDKLREIEEKNIRERIISYGFMKLFLVPFLEPDIKEIVLWVSWFFMIGILHIFSLLCRNRFEYLITFFPNTRLSTHIRILVLLSIILVIDFFWIYFSISLFYSTAGTSVILLLTFECFTLFLDTTQTVIKYGIYFIDNLYEGSWENRGTYIFYTEIMTDSLGLLTMLGHYIQILYMSGFSITFIDLIMCYNIRKIFNNLRHKITVFRNYLTLAADLNTKFPSVTPEELEQLNDDCAICRQPMTTAKKLPCGHIFHMSCLKSWMEHHHSCPTCRRSMITNQPQPVPPPPAQPADQPDEGLRAAGDPNLFRFNFERIFRWIPTLSVTVRRDVLITPETVQSLQEMFPQISPAAIMEDLARTHSPELTTENILEGRLPILAEAVVPPPQPGAPVDPQNPNPDLDFDLDPVLQQNLNPVPTTTTTTTTTTSEETARPFTENSIVPPVVPSDLRRFAPTPAERQSILDQRKSSLLDQARRRYLEKSDAPALKTNPSLNTEENQNRDVSSETSEAQTSENLNMSGNGDELSREQRRQRALEAAQLRMRLARESGEFNH